MSSTPQPTRPPLPPQPPRTGSHLVAIVLLILALIVVVSGLAVWTGLRFLSHAVQIQVKEGEGGKKEASIRTPIGSFEVAKNVDEGQLGLPIYPGARRLKDDAAAIDMEFGGEAGVHLAVAKFETSDPLDKVKAFYQDRLGNEVTKSVEKDSDGKTVFEIKRSGSEKIVALKDTSSGTRIELVRVVHGQPKAN